MSARSAPLAFDRSEHCAWPAFAEDCSHSTCRTQPARLFCEAFYEKLRSDGHEHPKRKGELLNSWDTRTLDLRPHSPKVLSTSADARAIVLEIPAGENLTDHQVHERAWVTVLDGEVEITTTEGEKVVGGCGLTVEFAPRERHAVHARATARLLLLLTPWPGQGHPGTMPLEDKAHAREHAAGHRTSP